MSDELQRFVPAPPPAADIFATHQLAWEFRRETQHRQAFQRHCEWYRLAVQQHQQEWQAMQGDINLFGWFSRGKSR